MKQLAAILALTLVTTSANAGVLWWKDKRNKHHHQDRQVQQMQDRHKDKPEHNPNNPFNHDENTPTASVPGPGTLGLFLIGGVALYFGRKFKK